MSQTDKESQLIMEIAAYVREHNEAAEWESRRALQGARLRSAKQRGAFSLAMGALAVFFAINQTSAAGLGVASGLFLYNCVASVTLLILAKRHIDGNDLRQMEQSVQARSKRASAIDDLAYEIWGDKNIKIKIDKSGKIEGILDVLACLGLKEEAFESAQGNIFRRQKTFA